MTKRVGRAILLVAGAVLLASLALIMGSLYAYFGGVQEEQLADELELAAVGVEGSGAAYLSQLKPERYRVTWVAADGLVLCDTQSDAATMENHLDREEVREALRSGTGKSVRSSATLLEKTVYSAKRLSDGTVLRVSVSRATVGALALGMLQPILMVLAAALILSFLLAGRVSKRVVEPLNGLDLDRPLENDAYEELAPLLNRLNRQQQEIAAQLSQLARQRDEFTQITDNLSEGLVVLDAKGGVVSMNPAARRLFQTDAACVGKDFLNVERSRDVSRAIDAAMADGHGEIRIERDGRRVQVDVSRVESDGTPVGAVLLAFDVTERELAEQNRREFTANVSHELKTPLQTIIGSAELMQSGMVPPEDMPRFLGRIRQEAGRLVALIDDMIRLSQLDEGDEASMQDVALLALVNEVTDSLRDAAEGKRIRVVVHGNEVVLRGAYRLLYETVYNLCDNAIKYNVDGGSLDVTVSADGKEATLAVRDSGIGIPPEHQSRVFERFYRVDKSHSRASGGTGLGLSIVKHAVGYHHGRIELQSQPGQGTEVKVILPLGTEGR